GDAGEDLTAAQRRLADPGLFAVTDAGLGLGQVLAELVPARLGLRPAGEVDARGERQLSEADGHGVELLRNAAGLSPGHTAVGCAPGGSRSRVPPLRRPGRPPPAPGAGCGGGRRRGPAARRRAPPGGAPAPAAPCGVAAAGGPGPGAARPPCACRPAPPGAG